MKEGREERMERKERKEGRKEERKRKGTKKERRKRREEIRVGSVRVKHFPVLAMKISTTVIGLEFVQLGFEFRFRTV